MNDIEQMRKLTPQEIDNAPEWANSIFINSRGLLVWFNNETGEAKVVDWDAHVSKLSRNHYAFSNNKPIPRKELDIHECEWSDSDIERVEACGGFIQTVCSELYTRENKQDVINKTKHFKLTMEDLK